MRKSSPAVLLLALLAALALALLTTGVAQAHPKIVAIEPTPDAQLDRAPERVRISFDEPLEPLSSLQLFDAQGRQVDHGGGAPRADDPSILELPLPPLEPGIYTAVWTIVGSDSHILKDNFAFTVLGEAAQGPTLSAVSNAPTAAAVTPTPPAVLTPAAPQATIHPAAVALRGAMLIGATGATGGLTFLLGVLMPALASLGLALMPALRSRWRLLIGGLLTLLLVSTVGMALVHTHEAMGRVDPNSLRQMLGGTRFGQALLARCGLALVLIVSILSLGDGQWRRSGLVPGVLATGLLLTFSASGHASAERAPLIPVLADWLHLLATSLWVGGLLCLVVMAPLAVRLVPDVQRAALLSRLFTRFSGLALGSVGLLVATGAYAALRELTAVADLWETAYGQTLLLKLLLFGGLLTFGAYHLLLARPRLTVRTLGAAEAVLARPMPPWVSMTLRAEVGLALVVLVVTGALTSLPPPTATDRPDPLALAPTPKALLVPTVTPGPTRTPVPSRPFGHTQMVADLRVRLEVAPASIGENRFQVVVTDQSGAPLAIQLVRLTFAMLAMDMGMNELVAEPEGQTGFVATGTPLSMVGDWQVRVLVRRADAADVEASFVVPVGEEPRPVR